MYVVHIHKIKDMLNTQVFAKMLKINVMKILKSKVYSFRRQV